MKKESSLIDFIISEILIRQRNRLVLWFYFRESSPGERTYKIENGHYGDIFLNK